MGNWGAARPSWQQPPYGGAPTQGYGQVPATAYGQPIGMPANPAYPGYPGYQQSPWPAPGIGARPVKKKSRLSSLIVLVTIFVIVGPLISSILSLQSEPPTRSNPPVYDPQEYKPPPYPPASTSGPSSTSPNLPGSDQYTPGPPDLYPDDPPYPQTDAQVDQILASSALYSQSMIPTECEITVIDLANAPVADIEDHMNEFVDCLMAAWYPPVVDSGFTLPHPSVTVYTHAINSACGQLDMYNAEYCTADQQIYYAQNLIEAFPSSFQAMRFLAESIIAHEFGHAVQYRTMIMTSEVYREYDAATDDEAMDYSRRLEMQADCFAGSFFNSVAASTDLTGSDETNIVQIFTLLGGTKPYDDDHGMGVNRAYWVGEGLHDWNVGACNTFIAPDDQVS